MNEGVRQIVEGTVSSHRKSNNLMRDYFPATAFLREFAQQFQDMKVTLRKQIRQGVLIKVASQVSHDIRSPLSALTIAAGKLQKSADPEVVALILSAVKRIESIATDLLQERKRVANQLSLNEMITSVAEEKRILLSHSNIQLNVVLAEDDLFLAPSAHGLDRVISNLLNNAIEACEAGGGVVEVNLAELDNSFEILIRDNGKGMSPEVLHKAGQEGFSSGKTEGNGLGIFSAKTFVRSLRGSLEIKSELDKGTTVRICLQKPSPA